MAEKTRRIRLLERHQRDLRTILFPLHERLSDRAKMKGDQDAALEWLTRQSGIIAGAGLVLRALIGTGDARAVREGFRAFETVSGACIVAARGLAHDD